MNLKVYVEQFESMSTTFTTEKKKRQTFGTELKD